MMVDDLDSSEQTAFVVEGEVDPIVRGVIEKVLHNETYVESKVPHWINSVCEDVMEGLTELRKPFKYIVTCVIMQNTGAGMHTEHSGFCDAVNDGMCVVKWPAEKSKDQNTMYCIVTVYGLGF
uniref:Dynein light chain n=1 Tax=Bicosoecida sp. CB-2014 TaxID=1486930 RepID=A0A7S1CA55_9STRA|mmetsp:Transcript_19061/g.67310  ORF Transcript_19061/g.67310 Transcript_19061/m.67310 type:complete len:123 (+) Transcript_19061:112-480(+)